MVDLYAPKRRRVARMLRRWDTGVVTLTRTIPRTPDPLTPWIPGTPETEVYSLDARVDGVSADRVDGTTILATDLMAIASPAAILAGVPIDIVPRMTDTLQIDGVSKTIKKIEAVPAAGDAALFHIFIGS
jgi:hypothetical protein